MLLEILIAVIIMYVCFILGNFVFKRFKLNINLGGEFVYSFGLGIAIMAYLVLILGLLGLLYKSLFWIIIIVILLICIPQSISFFKRVKKIRLKFNWLLIPVLLFLLLNLIGSLAPPTGWDTQIYHLPMAKMYIEQHKITYLPLIQTDLPALVDMLTVLGMLLKSDITGTLIFYFSFLVLVLAIYLLSRKYFNRKIAYLATIIFLSIPLVIYYASTNYTDMIVTLFTFLAVFSFFSWSEKKDTKWLVLAGIFLGLTLSTKITAIIGILAFLLILIIKFIFNKERKNYFMAAIMMCLIVFLVSEIWFIKAYIFTGNPVYPIAYNTFGGPQNLSYADYYTKLQLSTGGYGRNFLAYILSPFQLTANSYKFLSSFSISPLFLVFLPLFIFLRKSKLIKYLLLFSFGYYTFWFILHPYPVKLIPLLPILSILTSYSILEGIRKKLIFKFVWIFVIFSIIFSILMSGLIYKSQVKVALGLETKENYLSNNLQIFDTLNYANKNLAALDRVLMIGEAKNYYLNIKFQEGDPVRQGIIDYRVLDENQLNLWIKSQNITYIIINRNYFVNASNPEPNLYGYTEYTEKLINSYISDYTSKIYKKNNVFLYKVD